MIGLKRFSVEDLSFEKNYFISIDIFMLDELAEFGLMLKSASFRSGYDPYDH